jgi:hypothetical protein
MKGKRQEPADWRCGSGWRRFGDMAEVSGMSSYMRQLESGTRLAGASIWARRLAGEPFGVAGWLVRLRTNCRFELCVCRLAALGQDAHFAIRDILGAACYVGWFENDAVGVRRTDCEVKFDPFVAIGGFDDLGGAAVRRNYAFRLRASLRLSSTAPGARSVAMATLLLARRTRAVSLATFAGVDRLLHRLLRCPHPVRFRVCAESCTAGTRWA